MSALDNLQQRFNRVFADRQLDVELEIVSLSVRTETVATLSGLIELITAFEADSGWLTTQASNLMLDEWRATPQRFGGIIQAELAGNSGSLHIRQAREGWTATYLSEQTSGGMPCLMETRSLASTRAGQSLVYRIYWQSLDDLGCRATHFRFAGLQGASA